MKLVILGLSLSSSWGNGHATTYRALLKAFAARGHEVLFLERDAPWYSGENRDLPDPDFCRLAFYGGLRDLADWRGEVREADAVIVGSYVPQGVEVGRWVHQSARGVTAFYDIDTPVTLAKLEKGDFEYLSPEVIPGYDLYLSFTGGPTLERLQRQYGSPAARALYCSVDAEIYRPLDEEKRWDLSYLGTYSPDRQPTLERLLVEAARRAPDLKFCVAGPQYPDDIDWPTNVERLEHVPPADHPAFYARSRFTLNVTRADMIAAGFSPSVRLFEAAACGTPIISDRWNGLTALFEPQREIVLADDSDTVLAALRGVPEVEREAMGERARRRILAEHTAEHRAAELEGYIDEPPTRPKAKPGRTTKVELVMKNGRGARALVAGGAGFLGSHLCELLVADGVEVVCLDNFQTGDRQNLRKLERSPRVDLVTADVSEPLPAAVRRAKFDLIFNLACAASPPLYQINPEHTLMTSVLGTRHLLHLASEHGARFLQASTSEIYGDPHMHPQPETYWGHVNCTGPRACYDEGKRAAETLTFDYDRAGKALVRVARIFNTYGPRLSAGDGRVVSNFVSQALAGDDITVYGDGSQTRSFCYVDDLVEGLARLIRHEGSQPGPVNLGNPNERSIGELVDLVLELTGSSSEVVYQRLPTDDPKRRKPDIAKARALLDWQPTISLELGLRATIDWFESGEGRRARAREAGALLSA